MHRDIKPGNLYLTTDDELILLDFGSARQVTGTHTRSMLIFSAGYAPYEQYLQGQLQRQGPWTDIYGAAATLYHMLTGQRLPPALDRKQAALLQEPDPLQPARRWIADLPPALDAALLRALAMEPEQRLQTVEAFQRHLQTALAEADRPPPEPATRPAAAKAPVKPPKSTKPASPAPPGSSEPVTLKRRGWGVAVVVLGLAAAGGTWLWNKVGIPPSPPVAETPPAAVAPPVVETPPAAVAPPVVETPPVTAPPPPVVVPRAYWTVQAIPATAQIRIMNIGPAYRDGIELNPGEYDLEVSAAGYQTYRGWRTLTTGTQKVTIMLQPDPPVSPPAAVEDATHQKELDLQLAVVRKLLEARRVPAARRALEDAKVLDREGRVEAFRREQTMILHAAALTFLERGQRNLAKRVMDEIGQWDPQSSEYRALQERLARQQ